MPRKIAVLVAIVVVIGLALGAYFNFRHHPARVPAAAATTTTANPTTTTKFPVTTTTRVPVTTTTRVPVTTTTRVPVTTTTRVPVTTTTVKRSTKPALPFVGTNYGDTPPLGNPGISRDGFVNCDLPHPIAYIKFTTGYSELFTVNLQNADWLMGYDYALRPLPNSLDVVDEPNQSSVGITHVSGSDGCVINPYPG
jgi:hypothetical protein